MGTCVEYRSSAHLVASSRGQELKDLSTRIVCQSWTCPQEGIVTISAGQPRFADERSDGGNWGAEGRASTRLDICEKPCTVYQAFAGEPGRNSKESRSWIQGKGVVSIITVDCSR